MGPSDRARPALCVRGCPAEEVADKQGFVVGANNRERFIQRRDQPVHFGLGDHDRGLNAEDCSTDPAGIAAQQVG